MGGGAFKGGELVSGGLISGGGGCVSGKIDFPYTNVRVLGGL